MEATATGQCKNRLARLALNLASLEDFGHYEVSPAAARRLPLGAASLCDEGVSLVTRSTNGQWSPKTVAGVLARANERTVWDNMHIL